MGLFPEKVIPEWALPSEVTKRQHLADSLGVSPRAGTVVAVIRYLFNKHPDLAAAPPSGVSTFTMGGEGGSPAISRGQASQYYTLSLSLLTLNDAKS